MIDLGTQPLGHTIESADLDADRLDYLVDALDIVELPVVLAVFPRYDNAADRFAASRRGKDGLAADGLLPDGRVHADLEAWMRILEQPQWFVSARVFSRPVDETSAITRICAATSHIGSVLAVKAGGSSSLVLRATVRDTAGEILDAVGTADGFDTRGISAPTDVLAEALDATPTDASGTAARLAHIGLDGDVAGQLAAAMSTCSAHAEITSVTNGSGVRTTGGHPVALFDTLRGRILATSSTASDGRRWSTMSSGSDGRVRTALTELVDRAAR